MMKSYFPKKLSLCICALCVMFVLQMSVHAFHRASFGVSSSSSAACFSNCYDNRGTIKVAQIVQPQRSRFGCTVLFNNLRKAPSKRDRQYARLLDLINYERADSESTVPIAEDPLVPSVITAVKAADARKAASIAAWRVVHLTEVTSFVVLIEGYNNRQNQAIAVAIEDDLYEQHSLEAFNKEGTAASGWVLLDYGSVIIHVMTAQMKQFYKLEKRWERAEAMDLSEIVTADAPSDRPITTTTTTTATSAATVGTGNFNEDQADAAFWGTAADAATNTDSYSNSNSSGDDFGEYGSSGSSVEDDDGDWADDFMQGE